MSNIEGLDRLARKLSQLGDRAEQVLIASATKQMTGRVEARAKEKCPAGVSHHGYTGGFLRAHIETGVVREADTVEIRTGTNVEYGPFVEYGTGRRGEESGVDHPDDYNYGPKPGMAPRPYLRPAWDEQKKDVIDGIAKDLRKAIREAR